MFPLTIGKVFGGPLSIIASHFWVKREDLIGLMYELGFKTVFEQFDYHAPDITKVLTESYEYSLRGRFVGIR